MNRLSPLAFAAAMAATSVSILASSPAHAASAHVAYGDLDLSTGAGRTALDNRIDRAARMVCWIENTTISGSEACRRESTADAHARLQRATQAQNALLALR